MIGNETFSHYFPNIGPTNIKEYDEVELLGITFDKAITFRKYIENVCRVVNYKLNELRGVYN